MHLVADDCTMLRKTAQVRCMLLLVPAAPRVCKLCGWHSQIDLLRDRLHPDTI